MNAPQSPINFYHLGSNEPDSRLQFACRLTEKARSLGHRVFINAASPEQASQISDLLWRARPTSFLPHSLMEDNEPEAEPIAVGTTRQLEYHADVLINLSGQPCQSHQRFQRINEIICQDEDILAAARDSWRYYQAEGYQPQTHKL